MSVSAFFGSVLCVHVLKLKGDKHRYESSWLNAAVHVDRYLVPPSAAIVTITGILLWWLAPNAIPPVSLGILVVGWILLASLGIAYLAPRLRWLSENSHSLDPVLFANQSKRWNAVNSLAILGTAALFAVAIVRPI
jgi:hypothetical protein